MSTGPAVHAGMYGGFPRHTAVRVLVDDDVASRASKLAALHDARPVARAPLIAAYDLSGTSRRKAKIAGSVQGFKWERR